MNQKAVSVIKSKNLSYPASPYNPSSVFPELSKFKFYAVKTDPENDIYNSVRQILIDLELDKDNIGASDWNPFKELIAAGQNVVIKPNLVIDKHPLGVKGTIATITHASIIRPVIDYLLIATGGDINITICDVPLHQANWENLIKLNGLKDLVEFYANHNIKINLLDLRYEVAYSSSSNVIVKRDFQPRDPLGYTAVDLRDKSELFEIIQHFARFEITDYGSGTVPKHHNPEKNEYLIPNTMLNADLFVNMPKLKTHRKAGITFALKNLIGINGDKSWLAHHRRGATDAGGDEYNKKTVIQTKSRIMMWAKRHSFTNYLLSLYFSIKIYLSKNSLEKKLNGYDAITEGSWYGNDTVWRCIKDLNKIILYSDKKGQMQENKQRKYLCIGDGIIASDKEGPIDGTPRNEGVLIGGMNAVYVDRVAASILGFDYKKIPQIKNGFINKYWSLCNGGEEDIVWKSNIPDIKSLNLKFIPTKGWMRHIIL